MKKLEICVDLDAITADFFGGLIPEYNLQTGESLKIEDIVSWDMSAFVKHPEVLKQIFHKPGFFTALKPIAGAVDSLHELVELGHTIHIVSSGCTAHSYSEKALWCQEHLPFIPLSHVTIAHRKGQFHGDVLIDDGPHNAKAFAQSNPRALILGIEWPHARADKRLFSKLVTDYRDTRRAWAEINKLISAEANSLHGTWRST
jgi:5'(3')-deoxyribonucleotidase